MAFRYVIGNKLTVCIAIQGILYLLSTSALPGDRTMRTQLSQLHRHPFLPIQQPVLISPREYLHQRYRGLQEQGQQAWFFFQTDYFQGLHGLLFHLFLVCHSNSHLYRVCRGKVLDSQGASIIWPAGADGVYHRITKEWAWRYIRTSVGHVQIYVRIFHCVIGARRWIRGFAIFG